MTRVRLKPLAPRSRVKHSTTEPRRFHLLTHCRPMEFFIKFDLVKSGWSVVYIEKSQVIILKKDCNSFSEGYFCLSKQLNILSESSLFVKVLFMKYVSIAELCSGQTKHCSP